MSNWGGVNFQDEANYLSLYLGNFHDFTLLILTFVIMFVTSVIWFMMKNLHVSKTSSSHQFLEFIWTLLPAGVLVVMAVPSLTLLFMMEDSAQAFLSAKVTGFQWYWSYNTNTSFSQDDFCSYMVQLDQSKTDLTRLLDATDFLAIPADVPVRALISSADVLHAWAIPSLGVKMDACPGRLNESLIIGARTGTMYGQCSEICGSNHSFMPIEVKVLPWAIQELKNF